MVNFGYPYNDLVICKDSTDYLLNSLNFKHIIILNCDSLDVSLDGRQCGNNLALCNFAVVMELPDSLYMNWKSEFGVIFLRCSPR